MCLPKKENYVHFYRHGVNDAIIIKTKLEKKIYQWIDNYYGNKQFLCASLKNRSD